MLFARPGEYKPCGIFSLEHFGLIAVTIVSFKLMNDLLGMETADNLLIYLGLNIHNFVVNNNGIGSRFNADNFVLALQKNLLEDFMEYINNKIS